MGEKDSPLFRADMAKSVRGLDEKFITVFSCWTGCSMRGLLRKPRRSRLTRVVLFCCDLDPVLVPSCRRVVGAGWVLLKKGAPDCWHRSQRRKRKARRMVVVGVDPAGDPGRSGTVELRLVLVPVSQTSSRSRHCRSCSPWCLW